MNYKLSDTKVNTKAGINLISKEFWKYKKQLALIILCLLISTIASVITPQLLKYAIDEAINKKDVEKLWFISGYFVLLMVTMAVMFVLQTRLAGFLAQKVLFEIRNSVFAKLQTLPMAFFGQNQSGDIIQRLTGNVEGLNNFFSEGFIRMVNIIFSMIGYLVVMLAINLTLGSIVIVSVVIAIIYLLIQGKFLNKYIKNSLDNEGALASQLQETLNGFQIIKIYKKEIEFEEEFNKKNSVYFKSQSKAGFVSSLSDGVLPFIFSVTTVIVVLMSLNMYSMNLITQGTVIAYLTYLVSFFRRFDGISGLWNNIQSGLASASRVNELLQIKTDITNIQNAYKPDTKDIKGSIIFNNVSFAYSDTEDSDVLKDINLEVDTGKTIAVIGPTGGGKTSFVNLIARLYDIKSGDVLVDGKNVKEWDLSTLRKSIGYLIQDAVFFKASILENLTYDNPKATQKEVREMLKDFGAESFISSLPEGLKQEITSDTKILSAGQKQILALTRLMLRNPKILILDEATSNIDTKSEKIIQLAIEKARKGRTTFIIAHRLSTIFNADKIILIQNNTIAESGNHFELLEKKGIYYNIYAKFVGK